MTMSRPAAASRPVCQERGDSYAAWAGTPTTAGGDRVGGELTANTLDELRAILPAGLTRHEPTSVMSPAVVETWD
jgi:hypothetical protein